MLGFDAREGSTSETLRRRSAQVRQLARSASFGCDTAFLSARRGHDRTEFVYLGPFNVLLSFFLTYSSSSLLLADHCLQCLQADRGRRRRRGREPT